MKSFCKKHGGYSLVEVLVSVSVLLIAVVGPMTIAGQGIKSSTYALEQNTAYFLAQEGIEAIFALRGEAVLEEVDTGTEVSWDWFTDLYGTGNVCDGISSGAACSFGVDFQDESISNNFTSSRCGSGSESNCLLYMNEANTRAVYTHTAGATSSPFTRIITVESLGSYVVEVKSEVRWNSQAFGGAEQTLELSTEIYDLI